MALAEASWTHGTSLRIENPGGLSNHWRAGFFIMVEGQPGTTNWFHFPIPTPVIVSDRRLRVDSVMLRYRCASPQAVVHAVHIFDGENRIAAHDGLRNAPMGDFAFERFAVPGQPEVLWGLGLTVGVAFESANPAENRMEFAAAGCDFIA